VNQRRYPRTARLDHLLQEVVAEELERLDDPRLELVTVTGVTTDPDLRHATVWLASLEEPVADALADNRVRLQAAVGRQTRMKRTPELAFKADPAVRSGNRVEDLLRDISEGELGDDDG
jgi:ribosome-binding factor A